MKATALTALVAGALLSLPASAMTVADAPLDVLLSEADLVVHASVVDALGEPVPGPRPRVRTRFGLVVWEVLASRQSEPSYPDPARLEVVLPGGTWGPWTTRVPGVPRLAAGDEVVLLLVHTPWGYQPLGYGLGTWHVDPQGYARRSQQAQPTALPPALGLDTLSARLRAGPR